MKLLIKYTLLLSSLLMQTICYAQLPPDGPDTVDVPIDGGLSLLLAAGVGYGVKKVRDQRKKKNDKDND